MSESFSVSVKRTVAEIPVKNQCCKTAMLYGMFYLAASRDFNGISLSFDCEESLNLCERLITGVFGCDYEIEYRPKGYLLSVTDPFALGEVIDKFGNYSDIKDKLFRCEGCHRHFLRGAFLCAGTVSSPDAEYHLELKSAYPLNPISSVFNIPGIFPRITKRGKKNVLYIKSNEEISDFLQFIGARSAAFELMNEKIRREIRNDANRQNNFDMANIAKTIRANKQQIDDAKFIIEENHLGRFSAALQETVRLRYENPSLNLSELASLHLTSISKSGLTHRFKAISQTVQEIKNKSKED